MGNQSSFCRLEFEQFQYATVLSINTFSGNFVHSVNVCLSASVQFVSQQQFKSHIFGIKSQIHVAISLYAGFNNCGNWYGF
jgi:hypothetical protein